MANKLIKVLYAGRMSYTKGLELQEKIQAVHHNVGTGTGTNNDTVILLEINPVYTVGIRTQNYTIEDEQRLINLGADFHRTNRGGLITFHGPGQLVVYPILNLKNHQLNIRTYVATLEKTVIDMCSHLGIRAQTTEHTGVWVNDHKICAIGIHAKRYVTSHGIAINCNVDLNWFKHIVPCGVVGKGVTSLSREMGLQFTVDNAIPHFMDSFRRYFKCDLIALDKKHAHLLRGK